MNSPIQYTLTKVIENDCDLLFEWCNDKVVRENSFNSDEVKYNEHVNWFYGKLGSQDSLMYIFEVNNQKVGLMRLDKLNAKYFIINYSISKNYRGRGYSTVLLKLIKDTYPSYQLIGKVKSTNIACIKAFINAGYRMVEQFDIKTFYSLDKN